MIMVLALCILLHLKVQLVITLFFRGGQGGSLLRNIANGFVWGWVNVDWVTDTNMGDDDFVAQFHENELHRFYISNDAAIFALEIIHPTDLEHGGIKYNMKPSDSVGMTEAYYLEEFVVISLWRMGKKRM